MSDWSCSLTKKTPMKRKKCGVLCKAKKILKKNKWAKYRAITPAAFFTPAGAALTIGTAGYLEARKRKSKSLKKLERLI